MEPDIDEKQNADDTFFNVIDMNLSLAKGFFERIEELEAERKQVVDADLDIELSKPLPYLPDQPLAGDYS